MRRINWAKHATHLAWRKRAGASVLESISIARKRGVPNHIAGRFEVAITLDESSRVDLDAVHKQAIDFLVVSGLVTDDSKQYMRRVTLEWGQVSEGMRITVRGCE